MRELKCTQCGSVGKLDLDRILGALEVGPNLITIEPEGSVEDAKKQRDVSFTALVEPRVVEAIVCATAEFALKYLSFSEYLWKTCRVTLKERPRESGANDLTVQRVGPSEYILLNTCPIRDAGAEYLVRAETR